MIRYTQHQTSSRGDVPSLHPTQPAGAWQPPESVQERDPGLRKPNASWVGESLQVWKQKWSLRLGMFGKQGGSMWILYHWEKCGKMISFVMFFSVLCCYLLLVLTPSSSLQACSIFFRYLSHSACGAMGGRSTCHMARKR